MAASSAWQPLGTLRRFGRICKFFVGPKATEIVDLELAVDEPTLSQSPQPEPELGISSFLQGSLPPRETHT